MSEGMFFLYREAEEHFQRDLIFLREMQRIMSGGMCFLYREAEDHIQRGMIIPARDAEDYIQRDIFFPARGAEDCIQRDIYIYIFLLEMQRVVSRGICLFFPAKG